MTSTVTYGFAEFSATTGKFTRLLAPMTTDSTNSTSPRLMWVSPERTALIGVLTGPVFALADGRVQDIPWSQRISPPQGSSIDAAW